MIKHNKTKKAQIFSADIIVVIVVILFGSLFLVLNQINTSNSSGSLNSKISQATLNSKNIYSNLKSKNIITSQNQIDLAQLQSLNESQIKQELGIKGNFAIAFEKDGKLIKINPETNVTCIGFSKIYINGVSCK